MASEAKPKVRSELRTTPSNLAGSELEVTSHEGDLILKAVTYNGHIYDLHHHAGCPPHAECSLRSL